MLYHSHTPSGSHGYNLLREPEDVWLAKNFRLREWQCKDGSEVLLLHPANVVMAQALRDHFGRPVTITSGYRTAQYNISIGGADDSRHMYGMASDVVVHGVDPPMVADWGEENDVGGVGRYDDFTHLDVWKRNRRW